jgi:hypothetical protein
MASSSQVRKDLLPWRYRTCLGPSRTPRGRSHCRLLELFDTARQEWTPDVTTAAVERFERRLGEEISALRLEMHEGLSTVRLEIANVRVEVSGLRLENSANRFELLKWCFLFWVGQVFAVAGVVALAFRLMSTA